MPSSPWPWPPSAPWAHASTRRSKCGGRTHCPVQATSQKNTAGAFGVLGLGLPAADEKRAPAESGDEPGGVLCASNPCVGGYLDTFDAPAVLEWFVGSMSVFVCCCGMLARRFRSLPRVLSAHDERGREHSGAQSGRWFTLRGSVLGERLAVARMWYVSLGGSSKQKHREGGLVASREWPIAHEVQIKFVLPGRRSVRRGPAIGDGCRIATTTWATTGDGRRATATTSRANDTKAGATGEEESHHAALGRHDFCIDYMGAISTLRDQGAVILINNDL
jgi:hypothetical protein